MSPTHQPHAMGVRSRVKGRTNWEYNNEMVPNIAVKSFVGMSGIIMEQLVKLYEGIRMYYCRENFIYRDKVESAPPSHSQNAEKKRVYAADSQVLTTTLKTRQLSLSLRATVLHCIAGEFVFLVADRTVAPPSPDDNQRRVCFLKKYKILVTSRHVTSHHIT
ncbi:hypothetical protein Pelo_5937 [Pelomyxa schiedti]|nr:hypothetical protein Pelo_5937 [Pelomyxa schiedti]